MKKNKKIFSYKAMLIFSLIVSVVSISNVNAAGKKGPANTGQRDRWCFAKMTDCIDDIEVACGDGNDISTRLCESSETTACEGAFGDSSTCKKTLVPQTGFIAPPPTNNGPIRTQIKPVAPVSRPLVAPTKKTHTMPVVTQPKTRTMSAPTIQPVTKQRVEKPMKRKVATPASTNKNKKLIRQVAPATSKGVTPKLNQPVMRKMNSAPAVNGSKSKPMPTSKNNFDEADAIFGKRTGVLNTQAR